MNLCRVLDNNVPYQTNIPVYDASALYYGQLMMRSSSWASSETTKYYINAYTGTSAEAVNSIGVLQASSANGYATKENANLYNLASAVPSITASTGLNYLPAIVSPHATYFCEYSQAAANVITCTQAISASTTFTVTSLEDYLSSGWIFTTNLASSTYTYPGLLRYITVGGSGASTIDSAITVDTSTRFIKVLPIGHRLTALDTTGMYLLSAAAAGSGVKLQIVENYIQHSTSPKVTLRYWNHKGLKNLKNVRIEAELMQLNHCYVAIS